MYRLRQELPSSQAHQTYRVVHSVLVGAVALLVSCTLGASVAFGILEEVGAEVITVETPLRLSLQVHGQDPAFLVDSRAIETNTRFPPILPKPRRIKDFMTLQPGSRLQVGARQQVLELSLELIHLVSSQSATDSFSGTLQASLIGAAQAAALVESPLPVAPSPSSLAQPALRARGLDHPPTEPVLRRVGELFHVYSSTVGIRLVTDLLLVPVQADTLLAVGIGIDSRVSWPSIGQAQSYGASLLYCTPYQGNQLCFGGFTHLGHLEGPLPSNEMTGLGLLSFTHR